MLQETGGEGLTDGAAGRGHPSFLLQGLPATPGKRQSRLRHQVLGWDPKIPQAGKYLHPRSGRALVKQRQDRAPRLPCPLLLQLGRGGGKGASPSCRLPQHPPPRPAPAREDRNKSQKPTLSQVSPSLSLLRLASSSASRLDCLPTPPKTPPQSPSLRALSCPRGPE